MSERILVCEGVTERGLQLLKSEGFAIDERKSPPSPEELAGLIGAYDALLVRSGTKVTATVLEAAARLKVIGRPGVGVDNIDVEAATRRGIMVMNAPAGNLIATAELAVGLMLALARHIPQADAAMKAQRFDRKSFAGVELHGKRLGIVGLGRIGREVAARCRAFGMDVVAFDPFVSETVAEAAHVKLVSFDDVLQGCDYLTLHTTLSPETRHLLGKDAFARVKPGIRIVNAARGELVDPAALLAALESGRVAGAALDVHAEEPPRDWRLASHPRVVATPHVGASTAEAQERVGTDIAAQVRDYLRGGLIQHAVNFFPFSGELYDQVRPAVELARRLGAFVGQACQGRAERIELGLYGELRELDAKPILAGAVAGALAGQGATLVNALPLARERGVEVVQSTSSVQLAYANLVALRLKTAEAELSVAGTLFGRGHLRLVDVDGVELDAIPQGHLLLVKNEDRPGVVGHIGTLLGRRQVNIARMSVGRRPGSARAVMLLEVDNEVPAEVLAEVAAMDGVREARAVRLS